LLLSARDWILLYLAIELYSLAAYVLVAFKRSSIFSTEGALKYFIIGSVSSALLLLGLSFVYGSLGVSNLYDMELFLVFFDLLPLYNLYLFSFGLFFIIISLLIKLAAGPFHF
jgi:NADH:ubiquinone oxidoreductase subunit 2 (subunit N)